MKRHPVTALLTFLLCLGTAATATPATAGAREGDAVVRALERAAHPLRTTEPSGSTDDLRPLGRMVGDARVVGVGEATHSSHEFFALKQRVFRHLVRDRGFRTYALEAPWSTGTRLDDYVVHGKGDPRRILREDFQDAYLFWNTHEYLSLVEWMRSWNIAHPGDPVRFMGNDVAYAGPELYDRVLGYVRDAHPAVLPELTALYRGLRPTGAAGPYLRAYLAQPLAERRDKAARAARALELLLKRRPAPGRAAGEAHRWAVQNARTLRQTADQYAFDYGRQEGVAAAMLFRDRVMAENTVWWQEHTGDKILLSAHNGHVGLRSNDPENYPKSQGAFLRDRLGTGYVAVGLSFFQGSFNGTGPDDELVDKNVRRFTVGPAGAGSNEHTLDRVRHRDYLLDLRTAPAPARDWLRGARPTHDIGTAWPMPRHPIALGRAYDVLIHLQEVRAADRLPGG
ncbi:erythromycin esterase family protein [Streptomyces sp. I05A-00742]|uniref:erythromycin esterase family protein n=1 Tax=Streptomyces sp. I05A-00742 TaxID=2732853 RepID=UPI0014892891|nr:erythromycin esterase family protein [Streptomyces sp. I05A-00742]